MFAVDENVTNILKDYAYTAAKKLGELDFWNKLVEFNNQGGFSASSQASFILACPPVYPKTGDEKVIAAFKQSILPIGGVQDFSISENQTVVPVKEIGSVRKRMVIGQANYAFNSTRLLTSHSNYKRAIYKWLFFILSSNKITSIDMMSPPSSNNSTYFSGLDSEIYKIPFGLLVIKGSAGGDIISTEFLENCYLRDFNSAMAAQNPMISDNISGFCTRVIPLMNSNFSPVISKKDFVDKSKTTYKFIGE